MLNEERQWDDKGTGHVSATFVEANSMALVVISETDGSHLLESKIQHDTAYQKQQETLIVWSEGDNMDLALSFQEKTGCDDIWEKICTVQGKDPSVDITQDLIDDADDADDMEMDTGSTGNNQGFEFPTCDLNHLLEISEMFTQVVNYPIQRERLATALERSQYLKQLVDLFHKAEDLEDLKSLHHLYEIMRAIVQFNRRNLYELIFSDDMMMDTVGILEYNPTKRVKHRDFLTKQANFREVLPMSGALKNKIQQTYRVQYIQDSCMPPPSLFDDNAGSSLNSFVYLNKIDIITKLQDDGQFVQHLFSGLLSVDTGNDARRDLLLLLKEFCAIVNSLQPSQKESFFTFLCANRALKAIFHSFKLADESLKPVCVDIIQVFIENQASVVREFFVSDSRDNPNDALYLNILIDQLVNDLDSEISNGFVITTMLKVLIDPENMINSSQKNEKQEFLNFFYKASVGHLTRPLVELTTDGQLKYDDYHTAMVMHNVVELLAFCVEFHSYNMKNYAFHNNLLLRVVTLFQSQHKFLVLAALRVVRKFVSSKEEFNYRYIIKNGILGSVVALLDANRQYNMLNSAILELFEFIRTENISCLINNVVEHHWDVLQQHNYVATFQMLKARYDPGSSGGGNKSVAGGPATSSINMLAMMNSATNNASSSAAASRSRKDARALDEDEEQWYDQDDEEEDDSSILNYQNNAATTPTRDNPFVERFTRNNGTVANSNNSNNSNNSITSTKGEIGTVATAAAAVSATASFKLANRYGRDQQHIPINIKSTSLTLGSVSSTTTTMMIGGNDSTTIGGESKLLPNGQSMTTTTTDGSSPVHNDDDKGDLTTSATVTSIESAVATSSEAVQKVSVIGCYGVAKGVGVNEWMD